ncbi:MAG TPA: ketoacyl-ACP synthase III [Bryobacteraceae bacterium]|nr:ketoacyl-ACP synthase III [Bryobacteraceae bacterium]
MASSRVECVHIAGIVSAVPGTARGVNEGSPISEAEIAKVSASTGVSARHLVGPGMCSSDLCQAAAERLLPELGWERRTIEVLIFVSQTPDYVLPATACSLHGRLGLSPECAAFDVNLGCSGYVYGLWLAATMIQGGAKRVLVLAGDTISRLVAPEDRSVALLFGDAGSATAVEYSPDAPPIFFELGTDGSGEKHLMVPAGGFRNRATAENGLRSRGEDGNVRSEQDLYMNGGEIFAFTMATVPRVSRAVLARAAWPIESVDWFVMHQANRFMLQHLSKLIKIPKEKLVVALGQYGNTSCASIPLAISSCLSEPLRSGTSRLLLAGFGVGFSWGAAAIEFANTMAPPPIAVEVDSL